MKEEWKKAMEELGMIVQSGKNEHDDSADSCVQLLETVDGHGIGTAQIINSPI